MPTLTEFHSEFLSIYAEAHNRASEVASKASIFRHHLLPALGHLRLVDIRRRQIDAFQAQQLAAGLSPKTVNNHVSVLTTCLRVAREWEIIASTPAVKWLRAPRPAFDFLDFAEADKLVAKADDDWRPMLVVAVRCGLRLGELRALRARDVDLERRLLTVAQAASRYRVEAPKGGSVRHVPLCEEAAAALDGLREPLVFGRDGRLLTWNECRAPLKRACHAARMRQVGWHVLRHTFASHLVMRGAPIVAVQQLLGHSTIEMTMRYAHLTDDARRAAIALLDRPTN